MKSHPVILRGGLWIGIAGLSFLGERLAGITPEQLAAWNWLDTARLTTGFLLSAFIAWRAYIDQSASRYITGGSPKTP